MKLKGAINRESFKDPQMVVDGSSLILPFDNEDRLSSALDNHNA